MKNWKAISSQINRKIGFRRYIEKELNCYAQILLSNCCSLILIGFLRFRLESEFWIELRVALVGDTGVGKSSIAFRYIYGQFNASIPSTSGATFLRKAGVFGEKKVKLQIWDTAGQENFRALTPMYYRSAEIIVIVYDITRRTSFDAVKYWMNEIAANGTESHNQKVIMIGNKIDMNIREVKYEEGKELAESQNMQYFECSAVTGEGIEDAFSNAVLGQIELKGAKKQTLIVVPEPKDVVKVIGCC